MAKKDFSTLNPASFTHALEIQIRFVDIDLAGHVNNATILSYFELGRVAYLDELIGAENDWRGKGLILAHTEIDYIEPVYLHDKIKAYSRITHVGTKSFTIENLLVKLKDGKETFAAVASFVTVCFDYKQKQTTEIPADWRELLS